MKKKKIQKLENRVALIEFQLEDIQSEASERRSRRRFRKISAEKVFKYSFIIAFVAYCAVSIADTLKNFF